ncbi:hypothetical protein F5888DRAFT_1140140 [Russula emetica]|nr:hypothetical protein F5888DRAFT_1140140 [Russula emetica]
MLPPIRHTGSDGKQCIDSLYLFLEPFVAPKCRFSGCNTPVFFDRRVDEYREWCSDEHLMLAVRHRVEQPCRACQYWPRRNGYKHCSGSICKHPLLDESKWSISKILSCHGQPYDCSSASSMTRIEPYTAPERPEPPRAVLSLRATETSPKALCPTSRDHKLHLFDPNVCGGVICWLRALSRQRRARGLTVMGETSFSQ